MWQDLFIDAREKDCFQLLFFFLFVEAYCFDGKAKIETNNLATAAATPTKTMPTDLKWHF